MDMIVHDELDRKRFLANGVELVRCMRTLQDRFQLDETQAITVIMKQLENLVGLEGDHWKFLRLYATCSITVLCNLLWESVPLDSTDISPDAVAKQAAQYVNMVVFPITAEGYLRRLGAEKGVDFYAWGKDQ
jgi:hypothetical protein